MNKIEKIETFLVPPRWLFVRVQTSDGVVGWGESSLEGHAEAVNGAFASIRDRFIGTDANRIEDIWQTHYRLGFYRGGPVLMSALSGLDQALWDIKGKSLGVPVWQLLGGNVRDKVRVYAWIGGDNPSEVAEGALARKEQGFDTVKMNGTSQLTRLTERHELDQVVDRVAQVRDCGMGAAVDFHGRVHKPMAKQLAAALEPLAPLFIEEPLLSELPNEIAELSRRTQIPIALGERLYSRWDFRPFFEACAVDVIQPDLAHAGGLSECLRIANMAETYDVAVAPHCPLGPIALGACFQLAATTPNFAIQEMSLGIHYNQGGHDLLSYMTDPSVFDVTEGMVDITTAPGLGVSIDEEKVRALAADPHSWRNPVWRHSDGSLAEW